MQDENRQAVRLGIGQRTQEEAVDQGEDRCIYSDAQSERKSDGKSEPRVPVELSQCQAQILNEHDFAHLRLNCRSISPARTLLQDVLDTETDSLQIFDSRRSGVFDVGIGCPGVDRTVWHE